MTTDRSLITTVTEGIKNNITPILFGGFVLFIALSIIVSSIRSKNQIQTLITYAEESTPYILSSTVTISNESLIASNLPESYEQTIADLQALIDYTRDRKANIPDYPVDTNAQRLAQSLTSYLDLVANASSELITQQETVRSLEPELQIILKTQTILASGTLDELKSLEQAVSKVYEAVEGFSGSPAIYSYLTREYFASYDALKILNERLPSELEGLEGINDQDVISNDLRSKLINLIPESKYPLNNVVYPAVRRYQIENQEYLNLITTMQETISQLKTSYSLPL